MEKREPSFFKVEREFLSKYSMEEMLVRIIESHVKKEKHQENQ